MIFFCFIDDSAQKGKHTTNLYREITRECKINGAWRFQELFENSETIILTEKP